MPRTREYTVSVDLGRIEDYTAIGIAQEHVEWQRRGIVDPREPDEPEMMPVSYYHIRHVERMGVDGQTTWEAIVDRIKEVCDSPILEGQYDLLVDATGVGDPVVEMIRRRRLNPVSIKITPGHEVRERQGELGYNVPRDDLIISLQNIIEGRKMKVSGQLPREILKVFRDELTNFRHDYKRKRISEDDPEAILEYWRQNQHDDIVLMLGIFAWWKTRGTTILDKLNRDRKRDRERARDWNPWNARLSGRPRTLPKGRR